jgi:hypothetical protein
MPAAAARHDELARGDQGVEQPAGPLRRHPELVGEAVDAEQEGLAGVVVEMGADLKQQQAGQAGGFGVVADMAEGVKTHGATSYLGWRASSRPLRDRSAELIGR